MDKLHRKVVIGDNVYVDEVTASPMTEIELLKTIAPVEIPRLRADLKKAEEENARLREDLKEFITDAHMAGQYCSDGCDPSYSSALSYYFVEPSAMDGEKNEV